MLIRQLLENKKGVKAVKYNKKPKAHTPAEERKVIGPDAPKKKEKVIEQDITRRITPNADGSFPDPSINRLTGKPNPPAAEPAPSNLKSGGATVEYSGKTYDVMVFGDKSIRPRISGSDTVVSAKVYTKGNKMFVMLDAPAQESVTEGLHPVIIDDIKRLSTLNPVSRYSAYANIRSYFKDNPELYKMASDLQSGYFEADILRGKYKTDALKAKYAELEPMHRSFIKQALGQEQGVAEGDVEEFLHKVAQSGNNGYAMLYNAQQGKYGQEIEQAIQNMYDDISTDTGYHGDDDFEQIYDRMMDNIEADYGQKGVAEVRRDYDDLRDTGFGRPERDMSDESNLLYIYKNDRVMKRMVSNTVEREARAQGFRDTPEQALKMHGIIRSKFKPGKWVQKQGDQWVDVYPFGKPNDIAETATPGATSAGNVATLGMNPKLSPGPARGKKSYIGTPGKSGTKAPPQPKVNQPKTKHGTAVNALDMKSNIFGGGKAIKRK